MKTIIFSLLISVITLVSCSKDKLSFTEKNVVGEWEFEKVKYNDGSIGFSEDITSEYSGSRLILYNDKIANFKHQNKLYKGVWEVTINPNVNDIYETLNINLSDANTNELIVFNFNNVSVMRKTMWANKLNYNKSFTYKLKRK